MVTWLEGNKTPAQPCDACSASNIMCTSAWAQDPARLPWRLALTNAADRRGWLSGPLRDCTVATICWHSAWLGHSTSAWYWYRSCFCFALQWRTRRRVGRGVCFRAPCFEAQCLQQHCYGVRLPFESYQGGGRLWNCRACSTS